MNWLLVFAFAVACGGSKTAPKPPEPKPDPVPATARLDCKAVSDHMAAVVFVGADEQRPAAANWRKLCTDERWSDEVRSCFNTANEGIEVEVCMDKLPAAQRDDKVDKTVRVAPAVP